MRFQTTVLNKMKANRKGQFLKLTVTDTLLHNTVHNANHMKRFQKFWNNVSKRICIHIFLGL